MLAAWSSARRAARARGDSMNQPTPAGAAALKHENPLRQAECHLAAGYQPAPHYFHEWEWQPLAARARGNSMNEWEWQLLEDKAPVESVNVGGVDLRPGDRVRLRPRKGGDIFDVALAGMVATIEAIEQ